MSSHLSSVEGTCDAPSYEVVRACQELGFRAPLDVRWVRSSHLVNWHPEKRGMFNIRRWMELLGLARSAGGACSCGERLPDLRRHRFVHPSQGEGDYILGQCPRCRTVYWDEA